MTSDDSGKVSHGRTDARRRAERPARKSSLRWGIVFITAVVAVFAAWLVVSGTAETFFSALVGANPAWVFAGALCFVGFFMLDVLCYRVAGMLTGVRMGFLDLLSVAAVGIVFAFLTPGQTGAAPAQIVRLSQVGLKVGDATAVQLTKFFIYQAAVTLFGATVLMLRSSYFVERYGDIVLVSVLSFLVHLAIMLGLVAVVFCPNLVRRTGHAAIGVLSGRIHVLKEPRAWHRRVDEEVDEYAGSVRRAVRHPGVVGTAVVVTILQLGCLYCIPFCVLRALGVGGVDFDTALCASAFVQLVMTAVPLPGGTGGAEGGFALFFGPELGAATAVGVVLWRTLSYYAPIIISAPLMGVRSKLTPAQRLEEFGEAHVGREGANDAMRIAAQRKAELRDAADRRLAARRLRRGERAFMAARDARALGYGGKGTTRGGRRLWRKGRRP